MARITIPDINIILEPYNWKCISTEYKNLQTELTFTCDEGHKVYSTWGDIRKKRFCPVCDSNIRKKIESRSTRDKRKKEENVFRVIGLDQSSHKTGYAVFDDQQLIHYGMFQAKGSTGFKRMVDVCDWLVNLIQTWTPDLVGFEETQLTQGEKGHDAFQLLSGILGALMITAAREKVQVETVNVSTWRKHCNIRGRTRSDMKRSARERVKEWYKIEPEEDESEAICIGKYFSNAFGAKPTRAFGTWEEEEDR